MTNNKSKKNQSIAGNKSKNNQSRNLQLIHEWKIEISNFSYEEALSKLDEILLGLQNESVLIDEIKINYLKANLLLERCENLLSSVEQEVINIDPDLAIEDSKN
tara:strand:- start:884 stop:1195 length:312 start_codon:yes stop_codon:yes gene_type:complete